MAAGALLEGGDVLVGQRSAAVPGEVDVPEEAVGGEAEGAAGAVGAGVVVAEAYQAAK